MRRLYVLGLFWAVFGVAGCVTVAPARPVPELPPPSHEAPDERVAAPESEAEAQAPSLREQVVQTAQGYVGLSSLRRVTRRVPDDCSGLVRLVFGQVGFEPQLTHARRRDNATTALWREAEARGLVHFDVPRPGDLVFFRETYDRNRDGRRNDGLTHVGIVEEVAEDGVVTFIHRGSKGVVRGRLDRSRPSVRHDDAGQVVNDFIRAPDRTRGPRLTGQLFAGYAHAEVWLAPVVASGGAGDDSAAGGAGAL